MRKVLDLGELHKQLRQTEEHEPHFDEELNPYLLDTVLPQLEGERIQRNYNIYSLLLR